MSGYAIFGFGGFGRELLPLVQQRAEGREVVFVDDGAPLVDIGVRHVRFDEFAGPVFDGWPCVVAVADPGARRRVVERLAQAGRACLSLTGASALCYKDAEIGEGAVICDFSSITTNVRIGRHFHCNVYSYVAHDCRIGDFVTFAPRVTCCGNVVIEDDVYVGAGAVLRQGAPGAPLRIGRGAVIGMGAVVTKDVPPGMTLVGNPARPLIKQSG